MRDGEFQFDAVPVGDYEVSVSAPNFAPFQQQITVTSGKGPIFHFQLEIAGLKQTVEVSGAVSKLNTQSSTSRPRSRRRKSRRLRARIRRTASP